MGIDTVAQRLRENDRRIHSELLHRNMAPHRNAASSPGKDGTPSIVLKASGAHQCQFGATPAFVAAH